MHSFIHGQDGSWDPYKCVPNREGERHTSHAHARVAAGAVSRRVRGQHGSGLPHAHLPLRERLGGAILAIVHDLAQPTQLVASAYALST